MSSSSLKVLGKIFYEPKEAFESLKNDSPVWLPLLSLSLLTAAVLYWYLSTVDFTWFIERMVNADPSAKPEARAAMRTMITPGFMTVSTVGWTLISIPALCALSALYFFIVSRLVGSDIRYGKWFSFAAWVGVPGLLALPLMAVQIVSGHGRIALEELNMLSLNFLVFHLSLGDAWMGLVNSLNLTMIWSAALTAVGLNAWTGRSTAFCVVMALLPLVVVYGAWAVKIAVFH